MGRRSTNSTKAGKFMNPTDQARKEARKKELKKNKKQRQIVREAVIKQKDPKQIIDDLDLLDKMEYDTNNPPPYSAKVIQDKRRKLKESLHKIYQFYQKDQPKLAYEVKQLEAEYDSRHRVLSQQYESIMQAQKVNIEDIPLPDYLPGTTSEYEHIALPAIDLSNEINKITTNSSSFPKSILKADVVDLASLSQNFPNSPPGPPPSQPPDLADFECDKDEIELGIRADEPYKPSDTTKKIRFESEQPIVSTQVAQVRDYEYGSAHQPKPQPVLSKQIQPTIPPVPKKPIYQQSYNPPQQTPQYPPRQQQMPNRPVNPPPSQTQQSSNQAYLTSSSANASTTIEAKPLLRNKAAEITKFLPTSLLVRRDANKKPDTSGHQQSYAQPNKFYETYQDRYTNSSVKSNSSSSGQSVSKSTDADYEKFMNEIGKLL